PATSGAQALEKWRRGHHGLVITDLQMPEIDGYALARAIRAEPHGRGRPTIVAFTANTQPEALEHCTAAGMDDYLTKPAELATLRQKLARRRGGAARGGARHARYGGCRSAADRRAGKRGGRGARRAARRLTDGQACGTGARSRARTRSMCCRSAYSSSA